MDTGSFPRFRPIADCAVLVEFGDTICDVTHQSVLQLDTALSENPISGVTEAIPAYASLLLYFDPIITDHQAVTKAASSLLDQPVVAQDSNAERLVEVCYDRDLAPDLQAVSESSGLSPEQVIATHLAGNYRVYMYGFAPGYAYLGGVPASIQLPRKQSAIRDVAAGSVLIAGSQCLVTTINMPTGWWIIGQSPTRILDEYGDQPFLFDVGDSVVFQQISRHEFERRKQQ